MEPFFFGLIVGIVTSAPIGPVGLLTIQRTLTHGRVFGVLSGIGAAMADALYAGIAGLSLSVVANFLASARLWIHLGAGILCLWFGARALSFRPLRRTTEHGYGAPGVVWTFISSLLLTLANPLTILFFIVVFTTLQFGHQDPLRLLLLVAGVFSGCLLWWVGLVLATARLHTRLESRTLTLINRVSATFIIVLGLISLGSVGHLLLSSHPRTP
ncbi:MAG: LysE family translocator [Acidiferrobacter sp.]